VGNYKIIKLEPKDYYKCSNIWNMEKDPNRTKKWYDELVIGNRITFVYTENDEFIGEGSLVFCNDEPDYTIPDKRIYLSRLIVKVGYCNRGIGGIIIDYLINYARQLGYEEMSVGVDIENLIARRLYEKKGFINVIFEGEDEYGKYVKLIRQL
jgi:ribosomal protein S18 acetylase RimI-like enzyme